MRVPTVHRGSMWELGLVDADERKPHNLEAFLCMTQAGTTSKAIPRSDREDIGLYEGAG